MSCGCKTSGNSAGGCSTKLIGGCAQVDSCGNSYKLGVFDWLAGVENPSAQRFGWVEVRFKNDRKSFFRNEDNLPLHMGSVVTVEASPGHDVGVVSLTGELVRIQMEKKKFPQNQGLKIYRIASQRDIDLWNDARKREAEIKTEARRIAQNLRLQMKISDVEYQGDGTKVTFYYTAESRVDFRQLIKDLAMAFRTKIDMKQIGFRQEASKIGGIGSCGRELCCSTWLTDFRSVNTNAARYQQLSINPQKLAGQCGKLKCCLNYELDAYLDSLRHFPSSNTTLDTVNGKAFCIKIDVFKQKMWFAYADNTIAWHDIAIEDVKTMIAANKRGEKAGALEDYKEISEKETATVVDIIQEDKLDRFDRKSKPKKRRRPEDSVQNQGSPRPNRKNNNRGNQRPPRPEGQMRPRMEDGNGKSAHKGTRKPKPRTDGDA